MGRSSSQAILFELLRSYTALARTLNLSKAVRELGSTRQTVRRHISLLEERKGEALFRLEDRQYHLTEAGKASLKEANEILARSEAWLDNRTGQDDGLLHMAFDGQGKAPRFYLQQHALGRLWRDGSPLLQCGFQSWAMAKGDIESPVFEPIRPYLMVFRQHEDDWICVEIGSKSSYATWYGWSWERSSVGRGIADLPGGADFANLMSQPYKDVMARGCVRLDHIHTLMVDETGEKQIPASFQRLLMGCHFPDGSFALANLVDRTHNIEIAGLDPSVARSMPDRLVMNIPAAELEGSGT